MLISYFYGERIMPMPTKKLLILDKKQIRQKLNRIAYQILEDNFEEEEIVLAGIVPRGTVLAERLRKIMVKVAPELKVQLVQLDIDKESRSLEMNSDLPVERCKNKAIVLVDDVLNSGRTLMYGVGVFLDIPVKKIRTVVLVDRSHKSFPVHIDFTGMQLSTVAREHVQLLINGKEEAVYLL